MLIGYDAKRIVRNGTGLGSYGRNLINSLAHVAGPEDRLLLYAPDKGRAELREQVEPAENVVFRFPDRAMPRALWRTCGLARQLKREGVDVFHGLSGELPIGLHRTGIKSVVTIHDLIFLRHPEFYKRIDAMLYAWKFRQTIKEADRIIAISQCTKRDILHFAPVDADKISLVYQSCGTRFRMPVSAPAKHAVRERYALPARYIVSVGSIEERKNILLAVKALAQLPQDISLVVVGRPTPYSAMVARYAGEHGLSHRLLMLHHVGNDDLPAIYQMGEVCVYPSRYEGFGLPVIEAIQSGLPVVACTGSCLEEAGGEDSLYVDPDDSEALAAAVRRLLIGAPEREGRIAASQRYVQRFEEGNVAQQIYHIYSEISGCATRRTGASEKARPSRPEKS